MDNVSYSEILKAELNLTDMITITYLLNEWRRRPLDTTFAACVNTDNGTFITWQISYASVSPEADMRFRRRSQYFRRLLLVTSHEKA